MRELEIEDGIAVEAGENAKAGAHVGPAIEGNKAVKIGEYYFPNGFPQLNAKQKADRMEEMYLATKTPEERVNFLFDLSVYIYALKYERKDQLSKEEWERFKAINNDFSDEYLVKECDYNMLKQVNHAIGRRRAEFANKINKEIEEEVKRFPEDDPHRKRKAEYAVRTRGINFYENYVYKDMLGIITLGTEDEKRNVPLINNTLGITKKTTMKEFLEKIGVADENEKISATNGEPYTDDMKAKDFYLARLKKDYFKSTEKDGIDEMRRYAATLNFSLIKKHAKVDYFKEQGYNEEQATKLADESRNLDGEPKTGNITEWVHQVGEPEGTASMPAAVDTIIDSFNTKYLIPYEINKNVAYVDLEAPVFFNGTFVKEDVQGFTVSSLAAMADIFGEHAPEIDKLCLDALQKLSELPPANPKNTMDADSLLTYGEALKKVVVAVEKYTKEMPEDSMRRRASELWLKNLKMFTNGDHEFVKKVGVDGNFEHCSQMTFVNFPSAKVVKERNAQNKPVSYEINLNKYEEFMRKHKFIDQLEDVQKYVSEIQLPFIKAKAQGKISLKDEKDYKKFTYDHLKRQKAFFEEINSIQYEGDAWDFAPFTGRKEALTMDWAGVRYGKARLDKINRDIKALELGWSPEDLPLLETVHEMMKNLEVSKVQNQLRPDKYDQLKARYEEILNAHIDNKADRKNLIKKIKPIYEAHKKTSPNDGSGYRANFDKLKDNEVSICIVDPDERDRVEMINLLTECYEGLSAQHSVRLTSHTDTDEMRVLKEKTLEVINELKNNRDKAFILNDGGEAHDHKKLFEDVAALAKAYNAAKIREYKDEMTEKNEATKTAKEADMRVKLAAKGLNERDIAFAVSNMKRDENEKLSAKLTSWTPGTGMGKKRYEAAANLATYCENMAKKIGSIRTNRERGADVCRQEMEAGRIVTSNEEYYYYAMQPYDRGVDQILNYYGTNPQFIIEHCKLPGDNDAKMYTKEEFDRMLPPVDIKGVSSNDFAVVAFSVAYDPHAINEDRYRAKHPFHENYITYEDWYASSRTMFTLDMAMPKPRGNMARDFLEYTVVPAKDKAKEAFEAYKGGDNTKLVDILSKGIKEMNKEILAISKISYPDDGNFAYSVGMLKKTIDFAKKDKNLYRAIEQKLGKDTMDFVDDNLRLKNYMDLAYQAELKLNIAARDKKPLSEDERKACINSIVRQHFITATYNKLREENLEDNPQTKLIEREGENDLANLMNNGLDASEVATKIDVRKNVLRTPLVQFTSRLRTKDGVNKLNEQVGKLSSKLKANVSEKEIIKNLAKFRKELENKHATDRKKELDRRKVAERKAAERLAKQQAKNQAKKK